MSLSLQGIHHVTAVTGHAPANVDFYTRVLGLRLVKKTVNQDDVAAYHLFYGDEIGSPGTEVTFFDWPNAAPRRDGAGTIAAFSLRVPDENALDWWEARFETEGVAHSRETRNGRALVNFTDAENQQLSLVVAPIPENVPVSDNGDNGVPPQMAIRGLGPLTIAVRELAPTARLLTEVLNFRHSATFEQNVEAANGALKVSVFETGPGGAAAELYVIEWPDAPNGFSGIGGVHHVAFRAPNDEEHRQWQARLSRAATGVTPVIDRFYFKSIYFREPGGVLFEIATDGPGFATDEDRAHLGERLSLPPFLEAHRAQIEAGLQPLDSQKTETNSDN